MLARTTRFFSMLQTAQHKRFYSRDKKTIFPEVTDVETKRFLMDQRHNAFLTKPEIQCREIEAEKYRLKVVLAYIFPIFRMIKQAQAETVTQPLNKPLWQHIHTHEVLIAAQKRDSFDMRTADQLLALNEQDEYQAAKIYYAFMQYIEHKKMSSLSRLEFDTEEHFQNILFRYLIHCDSSFLLAKYLQQQRDEPLSQDYIYSFIFLKTQSARTLLDHIDVNRKVYVKCDRFEGAVTPLMATLLSEQVFSKAALHLVQVLLQNHADPDLVCRFQLSGGAKLDMSMQELCQHLLRKIPDNLALHIMAFLNAVEEAKCNRHVAMKRS